VPQPQHLDERTGSLLSGVSRFGLLADYMTPAELAAELGICLQTLKRWHAARIGPPRVMVARKIHYRRGAVQEWLLKREKSFGDDDRCVVPVKRGNRQTRARRLPMISALEGERN
jgi:hypothetical protein